MKFTTVSRRISLSPFPMLRHHSGTLSGLSITFQAFPSLSTKFLPFQSTPFLTPPFRQHSRPSLPFPASPFLSVILRFYLFPVSVVPRLYPFPVSPSLSVSRLPVSIRFPSLSVSRLPVSIRFPSLSVSHRLCPSGQLDGQLSYLLSNFPLQTDVA